MRQEHIAYFIGWDVGGWNCDKNPNSRDAIVILDADLAIVGSPWRGNLRESINAARDSAEWVKTLFLLCAATAPGAPIRATLAIDAALTFPVALIELLTRQKLVQSLGDSETNPYLFRHPERFLFRHGIRPLSPIKDMIGSQATKAMHVLSKFAPHNPACGVWSDGAGFIAIEAYPSPCKQSATIQALLSQFPVLDHQDKQDALVCALLGYLFANKPDKLVAPDDAATAEEGWIWIPKDSLRISDASS